MAHRNKERSAEKVDTWVNMTDAFCPWMVFKICLLKAKITAVPGGVVTTCRCKDCGNYSTRDNIYLGGLFDVLYQDTLLTFLLWPIGVLMEKDRAVTEKINKLRFPGPTQSYIYFSFFVERESDKIFSWLPCF